MLQKYKFDHIGVACKSIEKEYTFFQILKIKIKEYVVCSSR